MILNCQDREMMSERNSLGHVYRRGYFPSSYRTEHNHLNHQSRSFHNFKASIHFPFHNPYDLILTKDRGEAPERGKVEYLPTRRGAIQRPKKIVSRYSTCLVTIDAHVNVNNQGAEQRLKKKKRVKVKKK